MKNRPLLLILAAGMLTAGCTEDLKVGQSGTGTINLNLGIDATVKNEPKSRAEGDVTPLLPTISDLELTLTSTDGTFTKTWDHADELSSEETFKVGEYILTASYGDPQEEGFVGEVRPYLYGEQRIQIRENVPAQVDLTVLFRNSKIKVEYTDAYKHYFTSYATSVGSDASLGSWVTFTAGEERPAYILPGEVSFKLDYTGADGLEVKNYSPEDLKFTAEPQTYYTITLGVNSGMGANDAMITVQFDETLDKEEIEIPIEIDASNPPVVTPSGFAQGDKISFISGNAPTDDLVFNITAMGGISKAILTTTGLSAIPGWPESIDLVAASVAEQQTLTNFGLKELGLWDKPGQMAVVNFAGVLSKMMPSDTPTTFSLAVTDKLGFSSDPVTLTAQCMPLICKFGEFQPINLGDTELHFDFNYNGLDFENKVKFQYLSGISYTDATVSYTEKEPGIYSVTMPVPADLNPLQLKLSYNGEVSTTVVERVVPEFTIESNAGDIWATSASFALSLEQRYYSYLKIYLDGKTCDSATVADGRIQLPGLTAGKSYTLQATFSDLKNSVTVPFTTEAALAVPNGGFDNISQTRDITQNQGGKYTRTRLGSAVYNSEHYVVSEPNEGWASTNGKTCNASASVKNSWFVTPSVYNTSLSWMSTVHEFSPGFGGQTGTPSVYNVAARTQNAMVVRSVGWHSDGTEPDTDKDTKGTDSYYSTKSPSTLNKSAGKLFLGSYSYVNGSECINEGVAFVSRPTALKGYYRYSDNAADENARVTVRLLDAAGAEIAKGSQNLGAASEYTDFRIALNYSTRNVKAAKLCIMIESSDKPEGSVPTTDQKSLYEQVSRGAMLVVDDFTFEY